MTVKSIIDVDVNDAKFQRFSALFDKYQQQLAKTPNLWKNVSKENAAIATQFERMTASMMAQSQMTREQFEEDKKRIGNLTIQEKLWESMSKSSTRFAQNIVDSSKWLLKWGGLVGAGLLGGGLFGIDRLARGTAGARSSSAGLGLSIGQQKSFNLNFGNLFGGDASGFLGGVAAAGADVSKQASLYALGVNPNQPTADLALATLKALRSKAQGVPTNQLGLLVSSLGLDQLGVGSEDLRRLRNASPQEFSSQLSAYGRDKAGLNVSEDTARRWTELNKQLTRAGEQISRTFVVGLAPLIPAISHLSDAASKFLQALLKSDDVKSAIESLSTWLEKFSGKLSRPEFLDSVDMFLSDIGELADAVHAVVHPGDAISQWWKEGQKQKALDSTSSQWWMPTGQFKGYLSDVDRRYGLPPGTVEGIWRSESGDQLSGVPVGAHGEIGPFQFKPEVARQYGINPNDPHASGDATGRMLSELEAHYHGDLIKALVGRNWGEGNLDAYLAHNKDPDWIRGLPKEVKQNLAATQVNIRIENNTGGNAVVIASQLASQ